MWEAIKNFFKNNWKQILCGVGVVTVIVLAATGVGAPIVAAVGGAVLASVLVGSIIERNINPPEPNPNPDEYVPQELAPLIDAVNRADQGNEEEEREIEQLRQELAAERQRRVPAEQNNQTLHNTLAAVRARQGGGNDKTRRREK